MHFAALDQLLRLGLRSDGIAAGVGNNEFDLPSRNRVAALLEKKLDAVFHLAPAGGKRAGADREKADAYRISLPLCKARRCNGHDRANDNRYNAGPSAEHVCPWTVHSPSGRRTRRMPGDISTIDGIANSTPRCATHAVALRL